MSTAVINQPKTQGALLPQTQLEQVIALDDTVKACRQEIIAAEANGNNIMKALVLARATKVIHDLLTPLMPDIMQLAGSPMGFKTDRDRESKKYTQEEIQPVITVALLKGFQIVGNEFNIIARNFYGTKEGFERLVREYPGMRDLKMLSGTPAMSPDGKDAKISYEATWNLNGEADSIRCEVKREGNEIVSDTRIVVRVNEFMGVDGTLGKAKAKMYRRIWERITGSQQSCVEDVEDAIDESQVIEGTTSTTVETQTESTTATEQTVEPDLQEVSRQYVDEMAAAQTMDDSTSIFARVFDDPKYKWTADQRTKGLRILEKRQDQIREECGKRGATKSQKSLAGAS